MFIGERSIYCLKSYLDGWTYGKDDVSDDGFFVDFQAWIQERYGVSTTQSWAKIIAFNTSDQIHALDEAIKLLLEFIAMR